MFDWLRSGVGFFLAWLNSWTGNYALALLVFAVLAKILFFYFSVKQQKNQIAMAKLRPKIAKIEKKYAGRNDQATKQKMQQEIMDLQKSEGYSMAAGCLPTLIQLPIILLLYNVIRAPLQYIAQISDTLICKASDVLLGTTDAALKSIDQISLAGKLASASSAQLEEIGLTAADVAKIPNFNLWGVDLSLTPSLKSISILILIPILATAFQWLSMFLMKKWNPQQNAGGDAQSQASMKIMDFVFPLMTLFFTFKFSAMLGLYWIYQSIISIGQSYLMNKIMPMPKYTAEDIKEIERAEKEKAKAQRAAVNTQTPHKSLHYIDADDYDTLPEVKTTEKSEKKSGIESASLKDNNPLDR